jgi:hypothetical protein
MNESFYGANLKEKLRSEEKDPVLKEKLKEKLRSEERAEKLHKWSAFAQRERKKPLA